MRMDRQCRIARGGMVAVALLAGLAACAPVQVGPAPAPGGAATSFPGFDTMLYPGDGVMTRWRAESPYRWVGYYLRSPCHPRETWMGKRATLQGMGWGLAVLYVGEQDWRHIAGGATGPGLTPPGEAPRCTPANLTAERGAADAADAQRVLAAEGFPNGTVVYLNVERVDRLTPELSAYVAAWVGGLLDGGRYLPGLYAHASNAPNLRALAVGEFAERNRTDRPRLWVARTGDFTLDRHPRESGLDYANVWQGVLDTSETWGGSTLRIDRNVADSPSPSAPAGM
jgi:hypothetical protein